MQSVDEMVCSGWLSIKARCSELPDKGIKQRRRFGAVEQTRRKEIFSRKESIRISFFYQVVQSIIRPKILDISLVEGSNRGIDHIQESHWNSLSPRLKSLQLVWTSLRPKIHRRVPAEVGTDHARSMRGWHQEARSLYPS